MCMSWSGGVHYVTRTFMCTYLQDFVKCNNVVIYLWQCCLLVTVVACMDDGLMNPRTKHRSTRASAGKTGHRLTKMLSTSLSGEPGCRQPRPSQNLCNFR